MNSRDSKCLLFLGPALCALGCGSADGPAPSEGNPAPVAQSTAEATMREKVLLSVTIEDGHTVDFHQLENGETLVTETGREFQEPALKKAAGIRTLAGIYKAIQPSTDVPDVLVAADARAATVVHAVEVTTPPAETPTGGAGPKFYTAAEQTWFKNTFCANNSDTTSLVMCQQGFGPSLFSGWVVGGQFSSQSWLGSENVGSASFALYEWVNGSAVRIISASVNPGTYYWTLAPPNYDGSFNFYNAHLNFANSTTLISQAVQDCGESNQWSCSPSCGPGCDPQRTTACSIVGFGNGICE